MHPENVSPATPPTAKAITAITGDGGTNDPTQPRAEAPGGAASQAARASGGALAAAGAGRPLRAIVGEKASDVKDASLTVPPGIEGTVVDVKVFNKQNLEHNLYKTELHYKHNY